MKKICFLLICLCVVAVVNAKSVEIYFFADGGKSTTSSFFVEDNLIKSSTYLYYASYDSDEIISKLNAMEGKLITLSKDKHSLKPGAEWYAIDLNGKKHYFSQSKKYKAIDFAKEMGVDKAPIIMIDLHANWISDTSTLTKLELNNNSVSLEKGKSMQLKYKTSPSSARGTHVKWSSNNPKVATVDSKGNIKGISGGKTVITVTSENGVTDNCLVNVIGDDKVVINYDVQGGKMAYDHYVLLSIKNNKVYKNNSVYSMVINSSSTNKFDLIDYNNPNFLNIYKNGYTVKEGSEWCTEKNGKGKCFNHHKSYSIKDFCGDKKACNLTMYTNWVKVSKDENITVTYNMNGGTGCNKKSFQVQYNSSTTYGDYESLCAPKNGKYEFGGWHLNDVNGQIIKNTSMISSNKNHTLVASWTSRTGSVYMLDTRESSESILIRSADGHYMILDNGYNTDDDKNICRDLVKYINDIAKTNGDSNGKRTKIDYMVFSHPHIDHMGCTNYFIDNLDIKKIILKNINHYRFRDLSNKVTNYYKSKNIIDTLKYSDSKELSLSSDKNYLTLKLGETGKNLVHLYNYNDVFTGASTCNKGAFVYRLSSKFRNAEKIMASDGNGKYYYVDGLNSKYVMKTTKKDLINKIKNNEYDSNGAYRYHYVYVMYTDNYCNPNTNALALLVEFKTNNGSKYAYLPSDLGNINYGMLVNNNYGITSTSKEIKLTNKETSSYKGSGLVNVLNPTIKTKKVSGKSSAYEFDFANTNKVVRSTEYEVAKQIKRKIGDGKNILLYQPSHHGYNNDEASVKVLGIDNGTTYFVPSISRFVFVSYASYNQLSYYHASKNTKNNNHYSYAGAKAITSKSHSIVADFYPNGTVNMTGKFINCSKNDASSCKWGDM